MPDPGSQPLNVLVADEAKLVRLLIVDLLNDAPIPVAITEADHGTDACRQLLGGNFDIAILNDDMPGIDGLSALELAHRTIADTFVIVLSTAPDEQKSARARKFHAYELLKKPFTTARFNQIIDNYRRLRRPIRALIVDDSPIVRKIVKKLCARSVFNIAHEEADSGEAAIEVCADRDFDVMFLDVVMPGLSGPETLRRLRESGSPIKVVLMTADQDFQMSERLERLNPETVLRKPFTHHDIDACLHHAFGVEMPSLYADRKETGAQADAHSRVLV